MANVDQAKSSENNQIQHEYSRILTAFENPAISESLQQWSESFSKTFSRTNVKSIVDGFADNIQNRYGNFASADILDIAFNLFLEGNEERYRKLQAKIEVSGDDIDALVKLINSELGSTIILVNNDSLSLSATGISKVFQTGAFNFIKNKFRNNLFLQLTLTQLLRDEVKKSTPILQSFLDGIKVSLKDLKKIVAATSVARAKRDTSIVDTLIESVRVVLRTVLSPIQTNVNSAFDTVSEFALSLYVADEPTNTIMIAISNVTNTIVLRAAEIVETVRDYVNVIFNNILYGNGTSTNSSSSSTEASARKRRDVEYAESSSKILFSFDEFGKGLELRKSRSFDFSSITSWLNSLLKELFVNFLSTYYSAIGELVTYPIRYVFQLLINYVLPCTSCTSIL